jgi:tetratricopeptide (TPR) repeat protein
MRTVFKEPPFTSQADLLSDKVGHLFHMKGNVVYPQRGLIFQGMFLLLVFISFFALSGCNRERSDAKFKRLMDSAEHYKIDGKLNEAKIELQRAIDVKPKNADAYYKLAEVLTRLQKIRPAVDNYNTALNYNPEHRDARLHLAAILLANRQFELAENHIQKLLDLNPKDQDDQALILKANLEAIGPRKNMAQAREILTGVLKRLPNDTSALASLGNIELLEGKNKEAEELFSKAAKLEPDNTPLQIALADLYTREGRMEEAQTVLETLLKKNPEQSGLHYVFAEFLLNRGLSDRALSEYQGTINADARRHDARDRLYDMFIVRDKPEEAKKLTADLEKQLPDDPGVNYFRGRNAELDGKNEEALNYFLESIKLLNNFAPAFRRAGLNELKLGKETEGVEHLNQAVAIDPGEASARFALAQRLFARKEISQATEHLNQILVRYPRHLAANVLRADIALVEGDTARARAVYEFLVKEFPNDLSGYFKLGLLEEKNKNYDEAVKWYRKALKFDRNVLLPAQRLIVVLAAQQKKDAAAVIQEIESLRQNSRSSQGEYDLLLGSLTLTSAKDRQQLEKAKELLLRALEEKPDLIGAYFGLAAIDAASGDLLSATSNYQKLLEKNPKHIPTHMMLALTYERQGKFDEAAKAYRDILNISPRFGPAANNLAWLLTEELKGDLDEALKLAELAKEQLPKESSVTDTLAWVHFRRGSTRVALPIIEEAIELEKLSGQNRSPNPEVLYHLAEIRAAAGETAGAKQALTQAMSVAGKDHPKRKQMEELLKKLS